ncbi:MAG: hypothetical protein KJP12_02990 [Acidimicrobiia bacterium]|nr:hypothetical protein [Acidimicrobiia bacterium]NNK92373.1 hypothetical protein [Acidimicrobiia bacterium]
MRRGVLLLVVFALLTSACASQLGRRAPRCSDSRTTPSGEVVLQAQAVQEAEWGPCLNDLPVGWEYEHQEHKLGEARFWLDSDRMGDRFVTVRLVESCDVSGATAADESHPAIDRFVIENRVDRDVPVVIIPLGDRPRTYAIAIQVLIDGQPIDGRVIDVTIDDSAGPERIAERREAAFAQGAAVVVVDDLDVEENTATLILNRGDDPERIDVDDLEELLSDDLEPISYRATWFHVFEGGCIIYEIEADGPGSDTVIADLDRALGFYDLEALRDYGRSQGLDF